MRNICKTMQKYVKYAQKYVKLEYKLFVRLQHACGASQTSEKTPFWKSQGPEAGGTAGRELGEPGRANCSTYL